MKTITNATCVPDFKSVGEYIKFVEDNFHQNDQIKGIFTLGKQEQDLVEKIDALKSQTKELSNEILSLSNNLTNEDESLVPYFLARLIASFITTVLGVSST